MGLGKIVKGITSALGVGSGAGLLSAAGGLASNFFSAKQASKNRAFQAHMSNTQYQRGMADMKAAGLNPILAYQKGGASTPSGSMAQISNPFRDVPNAVNSAIALQTSKAQINNLKSQTALNLEKANTERTTQGLGAANTRLAEANEIFTGQKTKTEIANTQKTWDQITRILIDNDVAMAEGDLKTQMAIIDKGIRSGKTSETLRWIKLNLGIEGKDALDLVKHIKSMRKNGAVPKKTSNKKFISRNPNSKGSPTFNQDGTVLE